MSSHDTHPLDALAVRLGLDDNAHRRLLLANTAALILSDEHADALNVTALVEYVEHGTIPVAVEDRDRPAEPAVEGPPAHVWETPGTAFGPSTRKPDGPIR